MNWHGGGTRAEQQTHSSESHRAHPWVRVRPSTSAESVEGQSKAEVRSEWRARRRYGQFGAGQPVYNFTLPTEKQTARVSRLTVAIEQHQRPGVGVITSRALVLTSGWSCNESQIGSPAGGNMKHGRQSVGVLVEWFFADKDE